MRNIKKYPLKNEEVISVLQNIKNEKLIEPKIGNLDALVLVKLIKYFEKNPHILNLILED